VAGEGLQLLDEQGGLFPGADIVPNGKRAATMAVTIKAPPERIWPWLAQMGYDRAGWYSWDRFDNGGRPSAERIHSEWEEIKLGDRLTAWSPGGPVSAWEVAALEPGHFLGLHGLSDVRGRQLDSSSPRPRVYLEGLWGFLLERLSADRTRLVVSGYGSTRPRWLQSIWDVFVYPPVHWSMQTRQFANIKRRAERDWAHHPPTQDRRCSCRHSPRRPPHATAASEAAGLGERLTSSEAASSPEDR